MDCAPTATSSSRAFGANPAATATAACARWRDPPRKVSAEQMLQTLSSRWVRFACAVCVTSREPHGLIVARWENSATRGLFIPARCAFGTANAQRRMNGWKAGQRWLRFDESFFARMRRAERIGGTVDSRAPLLIDRRMLHLGSACRFG